MADELAKSMTLAQLVGFSSVVSSVPFSFSHLLYVGYFLPVYSRAVCASLA